MPVVLFFTIDKLICPSPSRVPCFIPGGVRNFNLCPETERVCVVSCIFSGCDRDIVLTTHSGRSALVYLSSNLVPSLCSPYRHMTHGNLECMYVLGAVCPKLGGGGRVNSRFRKEERKIFKFDVWTDWVPFRVMAGWNYPSQIYGSHSTFCI